MNDWDLAYRNDYEVTNNGGIVIPIVFTESELIVHVEPDKYVQNSGLLKQVGFISGLGETVVQTHQLRLDREFIDCLSIIPLTSYKLVFIPTANFRKVRLSIWKPAMPLSRGSTNGSISPVTSSAANATAVAVNTAAVTILDANANRKGATIWNASAATLYLEMGESVSDVDYAVSLSGADYFELPYGYTGLIKGVWGADDDGQALVREYV